MILSKVTRTLPGAGSILDPTVGGPWWQVTPLWEKMRLSSIGVQGQEGHACCVQGTRTIAGTAGDNVSGSTCGKVCSRQLEKVGKV